MTIKVLHINFITGGLSKWCGAGGWRLGYFIIPDNLSHLRDSINVLASETFSSVSAPIQYAAISAYQNDHSSYISWYLSNGCALVELKFDLYKALFSFDIVRKFEILQKKVKL